MRKGQRFLRAGLLGASFFSITANAAAASLSGFWAPTGSSAAAPRFKPGIEAKAGTIASPSASEADLKWCVVQGLPYVMKDAGPIDIIQGPREILLSAEKLSLQRHIYTDRSSHPDMETFDQTPVGDSIGKWQNDVLVIDTVGMTDGVGPAGIPRTASSHLVERVSLSGETLTVDSIWSDKTVLAQPYHYVLTYKKLPSNYVPVEYWCDVRQNGVIK